MIIKLKKKKKDKELTTSRACSNPATNFSPTSKGSFKFFPAGVFHHSVKLNFVSTDVSDPPCSGRLPSGSVYVPGFLMSEKLWKAILTGSGI